MRIVFAGTPEFAVPSLRALVLESPHEVVGVLTRDDAPRGRKRVLTPSPVADAAGSLSLPVCKTKRINGDTARWLSSLDADLGVIVAYGGLLREPVLSLPRLGWINLHFSDLPAWRGAAPVQRALMAGQQRLGVSVFRLVDALDAGAVLTRDARDFEPGTSAGEALIELATWGSGTLLRAVNLLEADPEAGEPQHGEPSYAHKLSRDDGHIDLSLSVHQALAWWAGVTPEPGGFVWHEGMPLKLLEVRALPAEQARHDHPQLHQAGAVEGSVAGATRLIRGRAMLLLEGGALELVRVQPAGKTAMSGADWLRGRGGEVMLS